MADYGYAQVGKKTKTGKYELHYGQCNVFNFDRMNKTGLKEVVYKCMACNGRIWIAEMPNQKQKTIKVLRTSKFGCNNVDKLCQVTTESAHESDKTLLLVSTTNSNDTAILAIEQLNLRTNPTQIPTDLSVDVKQAFEGVESQNLKKIDVTENVGKTNQFLEQHFDEHPNEPGLDTSSTQKTEPRAFVQGNDDKTSGDDKRKIMEWSFNIPLPDLTPTSSFIIDPENDFLAAKFIAQDVQEKIYNFFGFLMYYIDNRNKFIANVKKAKLSVTDKVSTGDAKGFRLKLQQQKDAKVQKEIEVEMQKLETLDLFFEQKWDDTLEGIKANDKAEIEWKEVMKKLYSDILPNHEVVNETIECIMEVDASTLDRISMKYEKTKVVMAANDWSEKAKEYFADEHGMKEVVDKLFGLIDDMDTLYSIIDAANVRRNELFFKISEINEAKKIAKHLSKNYIEAQKIFKKCKFMQNKIVKCSNPSSLPSYEIEDFANLIFEVNELDDTMDIISNLIEPHLTNLRALLNKAMGVRFLFF